MSSRVGLSFPDDLRYEEWEDAGTRLVRIADSAAWCLGDWLILGENKFNERYRRAADNVGLEYQTLRNYAWVARKFQLPRRRPALSFQHHAEVASMDVEAQDRWLSLAEENSWSRNQFRRQIRELACRSEAAEAPVARLTVAQEHLNRWREAAARSSQSVDSWLVSTLNSAADQVFLDDAELSIE
jgi:hypothetical protein